MNDKLPPKSVADIQQHIDDTCRGFEKWTDVEIAQWTLSASTLKAVGQSDIRLALLAAIGVDIVRHIRAGGGVVLTEPPAQPKKERL